MQPLADAACELPWLAPCAGSLIALTRQPTNGLWTSLRSDPGMVLLLLRQHESNSANLSFQTILRESGVLELALECLGRSEPSFVDWHQPDLAPIYRACIAYARTAEALALQTNRCDAEIAWVGGLLAPLGSIANLVHGLSTVRRPPSALGIARRLAVKWQLPRWLSAIVGYHGLPFDAVRDLGADPQHFRIVQLAIALVEKANRGIGLTVGSPIDEITGQLGLPPAKLQAIVDGLEKAAVTLDPPAVWQNPHEVPLLPDLLRLALENHRCAKLTEIQRLQADVDALHNTIARQFANEGQRLHDQKLRALAEFAAGAGHEINNPLAVISGQAQYLLASEQEPNRRKALQTIIGQTQRIHQTLTQLMQFARPTPPKQQRVDLSGLVREIAGSLQGLADERQVRLTCAEPPSVLTLQVDPAQMRSALSGLLRNAVEAAPAGGWASLRVERDTDNSIKIIVEDNGGGLNATDREHLFDPFYSGRKAGRGRGLGLPAAWQLVRQHGGEVRFDPSSNGTTRFFLTLPAEAVVETLPIAVEQNALSDCLPVAKSA